MEHSLRILLVEDDEVDRQNVKRKLKQEDFPFELTEAHDITTAIEFLENRKFDCALVDYNLPDGTGLEILKKFQDEPFSAPPVIVLTSQDSPTVAVELMKAGAMDYLPKSEMSPSRIGQSIRNAMRLQNAEKQARDAIEQLQRSEKLFRDLFESSPDAIYVEDHQGMVLDANPAACLLHGCDRDELVGKNVQDLVPPAQHDEISHEFPKVTSGEITEFESTSWTVDGRAIPVEIRASHITYNAQPALLLHVNDITERKHARELLEKRVDERTAELNAEITERKKTEQQLRAFQATLRSVASELNIAEEGERRRISQGIHDHIGQILAITKIKLGALRQATANTDNSKSIEDIRDLVNEVIQYTRTLTFELGSPILYELGLKAALESLAEHHEKQHGTRTSLTSSANGYDLPNDVRTVLYQAVRELLHNVAKHAEANSVMISIDTDEQNMRVNVDDNGSGFDVSNTSFEVAPTGGFGLFQLRERLDHLGGQLRIESVPGQGTHVSLIVPLKPQKDVMLGRGT